MGWGRSNPANGRWAHLLIGRPIPGYWKAIYSRTVVLIRMATFEVDYSIGNSEELL
jgi:hypothetical protein